MLTFDFVIRALFASADIDNGKQGLSHRERLRELSHLVDVVDDTDFRELISKAFKVHVDLDHDTTPSTDTFLAQELIDLLFELVSGLSAAVRASLEKTVLEDAPISIDEDQTEGIIFGFGSGTLIFHT